MRDNSRLGILSSFSILVVSFIVSNLIFTLTNFPLRFPIRSPPIIRIILHSCKHKNKYSDTKHVTIYHLFLLHEEKLINDNLYKSVTQKVDMEQQFLLDTLLSTITYQNKTCNLIFSVVLWSNDDLIIIVPGKLCVFT